MLEISILLSKKLQLLSFNLKLLLFCNLCSIKYSKPLLLNEQLPIIKVVKFSKTEKLAIDVNYFKSSYY